MAKEREMIIRPHDGLLGDPAVPVRVGAPPVRVRRRPAFGVNPMSGWLFLVAAGLFVVATGAGIITGSLLLHALAFWAALLVGHFSVSYFMWVDPLPISRFVAIPVGVVGLFGFCLLSFLALHLAPAWLGWLLVIGGLLGIAAGVVPLTTAWIKPVDHPAARQADATQVPA